MLKPKVTVVIPSIRYKFLDGVFRSLEFQSLKEWECLFFNNRPIEWGRKKFSFQDSRIRVFGSPGESWPVSVNKAFGLANTEFLVMMHDDDMSFPDRFAVSYDYIQDCDIFYPSHIAMDVDGRLMSYWKAQPFNLERHKNFGGIMPFPFVTFRHNNVTPFNPEFPILADWVWWLENKDAKKSFTLTPLGIYRLWQSTSRKKDAIELREKEVKKMRELLNDPTLRAQRPKKWMP